MTEVSQKSKHADRNGCAATSSPEQLQSRLGILSARIGALEVSLQRSGENELALIQKVADIRERECQLAKERQAIAEDLDRQRRRAGESERSRRVQEAEAHAFRESIPQLAKRLVRAVVEWPRTRHRNRALHRLISGSDWFDAAWYRSTYPDVASSGADPAWHYLRHGAPEGRNPGPRFHTNLYLALYPDVEQAGVNPLAHFVQFGIAEKRWPAQTQLDVTSQNSSSGRELIVSRHRSTSFVKKEGSSSQEFGPLFDDGSMSAIRHNPEA